MEYDYEMEVSTGRILEKDIDIVYNTRSCCK